MLSGCLATDEIRLSTHRSGCRGCLDDLKGFAENFSVAEVFTLKTGAIGGSDYGFERDVIGHADLEREPDHARNDRAGRLL